MSSIIDNKEKSIRATDIKQVNFFGDQLIVAKGKDGSDYTAMKPICAYLGINWGSQFKKIKSNEVLNSTVVIITTVDSKKASREMLMMKVRMLPFWLATLHPAKIRKHLRPKLLKYQKEVADVLANVFIDQLNPITKLELLSQECEDASKYAKNYFDICTMMGNKESVAKANTVQEIKRSYPNIGVNELLPENVSCVQDRLISPTELGEELNLNAVEVNKKLELLGFQFYKRDYKKRKYWCLTDKGIEFGQYLDTGKKRGDGTPVQQIKSFYIKILEILKCKI